MKKYNVHIYTLVRVKVVDVEARNQKDAIEKAENMVDFAEEIRRQPGFAPAPGNPRVEIIEWAEDHRNKYLVDEQGDEEHNNSKTWERGSDGALYREEPEISHN
jgi:hypothetical protein